MATYWCGKKLWQLSAVGRSYGNLVLWAEVMANDFCGQKLWQLSAVGRSYGN